MAIDEQLQQIRDRMPELFMQAHEWRFTTNSPLLYYAQENKFVVVDNTEWGDPNRWFFIGDIHADFFALHTLLHKVRTLRPDFKLVFLGDLIDRGEHPIECFLLLVEWAIQHPQQVIWIAGNHDIGLSYDENNRIFRSEVEPSEAADILNFRNMRNRENSLIHNPLADAFDGFRRAVGKLFVLIASHLPRAVLFPDGLLATHGGIPHSDLQLKGKDAPTKDALMAWLNAPECLQDFTWTRLTKWAKKIPNRASRGCDFGYQDFEMFCEIVSRFFPVNRMIRGHDHPKIGWEQHREYKHRPAMTLTGFGFHYMLDAPERFEYYKPVLVLARYVRDSLPEIIEALYNKNDLEGLYPQKRMEVPEGFSVGPTTLKM
jgi:Calcineurin-like phosphoesterase